MGTRLWRGGAGALSCTGTTQEAGLTNSMAAGPALTVRGAGVVGRHPGRAGGRINVVNWLLADVACNRGERQGGCKAGQRARVCMSSACNIASRMGGGAILTKARAQAQSAEEVGRAGVAACPAGTGGRS